MEKKTPKDQECTMKAKPSTPSGEVFQSLGEKTQKCSFSFIACLDFKSPNKLDQAHLMLFLPA